MKNVGYMMLGMAVLGAGYCAYSYLGNNKTKKTKLQNMQNIK